MRTKLFCLILLSCVPLAAAAQTADEIIAKILMARGGLDKIRAVQAQRITGQISFGPDASGPFIVEFKRPLKMRMQLTVQNHTVVRAYDGETGWSNNPFAGQHNPDTMNNEELKSIAEEADFDGPLVDYQAKGNKIELAGKDQVQGKDVWRLKVTIKNGDVRNYLYDSNSFLLLKWEGSRKSQGKELPIQTYFRDYRDVEGLKFPFEIESGSPAANVSQKISVENIELDPILGDIEFGRPVSPPAEPAPAAVPAPAPAEKPPAPPN
jgi:outer membrane lipoprotein-sorting protein